MKNDGLIDYLGNMCGFDLKANNLSTKIEIAKSLLGNYFTDIPTSTARGITDLKIINEIRNFTQIIG